MSFAAEKRILTDEEFMSLAEGNSHYELINGEVIDLGNSGMEHGNISAYLCGWLSRTYGDKKILYIVGWVRRGLEFVNSNIVFLSAT